MRHKIPRQIFSLSGDFVYSSFCQSKMLCDNFADLFPCIYSVILTYNSEKNAFSIFVVTLFAVNKCETAPVIIHNCITVFATVNYAKNELLFGIASVKETLYTHRLRLKHNCNVIVIGNLFQQINRYVRVNDYFFIL